MDMVQVVIFDVGWIFFAAWSMALAVFSVLAFGRGSVRANSERYAGGRANSTTRASASNTHMTGVEEETG